MSAQDAFWSATVTDWIQALGTVASVGVAVWATVIALRTKARGQEVAESVTGAGNTAINELLAQRSSAVRWEIVHIRRSLYLAYNRGSVAAQVTEVNNVSEGARDALTVQEGLVPAEYPPGGALPLRIKRSAASPYVTRVEIAWNEEAGTFRQVYSVV
jgi:hypothetical protein